ncbi:MAG: cyclic nucleotide-binding domain-containing protein [Bacteroidetes bacterium]|jgi:CRP/FNR family transcriptional regulator|nr:cyclic nucleotide-binding domain-containing protein [Bacteroidota bacterium]
MDNFPDDIETITSTYEMFQELTGMIKAEMNNAFISRDVNYTRGETIFKQGTFISHIVFIRNGLVKASVESDNGRTTVVKLISSNQFLGLPVLFGSDFHGMSCTAMKDTCVCQVKREYIQEAFLKNVRLTHFIMEYYNREFLYLYDRLSNTSAKNNHGKLAQSFLYLLKDEFMKEDVFKHITRKEIAELATISLESANKLINELKNDLIIRIEEGNTIVDRPDLLEHLSRLG